MNNQNAKKEVKVPIEDTMVNLLMEYYEPIDNPGESDQQKDTQEFIEEMELMQNDISRCAVNALMQKNGFRMHYTGSGYVWLLKIKRFNVK